jgi:hypothetical protein
MRLQNHVQQSCGWFIAVSKKTETISLVVESQ